MKRAFLLIIAFLAVNGLAQDTTPIADRKLTIQTYDGGSVVTELLSVKVNGQSSLHRRWYVIRDSTCPVELGRVGVRTTWSTSSSGFLFVPHAGLADPVADLTAQADVSAVEVGFTQFDLWGNHDRNLSATEVEDLPRGKGLNIRASWPATQNDVEEYLTSVAYIRRAMTAEGKIWRADFDGIAAVLQTVGLRTSASDLESAPRKRGQSGKN